MYLLVFLLFFNIGAAVASPSIPSNLFTSAPDPTTTTLTPPPTLMPPPPGQVNMPDPSILSRIDTLGLFSTPSKPKPNRSPPQQQQQPKHAHAQHSPFARDAKTTTPQQATLSNHPPPPMPPPKLPPPKKTRPSTVVKPIDTQITGKKQKYDYLPSYASNLRGGKAAQPAGGGAVWNANMLAQHFSALKKEDAQHKKVLSKFLQQPTDSSTSNSGGSNSGGSNSGGSNSGGSNNNHILTYNDMARHFTVDPLRPVQTKPNPLASRNMASGPRKMPTKLSKFLPRTFPQHSKTSISTRTTKHHTVAAAAATAPMATAPPPVVDPFVLKWTSFIQTVLHRMRGASLLSDADAHDLRRHFHNILHLFVAGGVPTSMDQAKLKKEGFGNVLTYRTTSVNWHDMNKHPQHESECRFARGPNKKIDKDKDIECNQEESPTSDSIAWQIEMPSIKHVAMMSDRLQNTMPRSKAIPLGQALACLRSSTPVKGTGAPADATDLQTVLQTLVRLGQQLASAGAPSDWKLDNGFFDTEHHLAAPGTTFFKGVRHASVQRVAQDLLQFPELPVPLPNENEDVPVLKITAQVVFVVKFLHVHHDQVVGIHVLLDQVSIYRRGLIVTGQTSIVCHSIPIFDGAFGIDVCIGPPTAKPFTYTTYEQGGEASETGLTVGSGGFENLVFPFDAVVAMKLVVGAQIMELPFLSLVSAAIPIHPFMTETLGGSEHNDVGGKQATPVQDTENWDNNANRNCASYVTSGWCANGTVLQAWTVTAQYNHPDQNCVACGKGKRK